MPLSPVIKTCLPSASGAWSGSVRAPCGTIRQPWPTSCSAGAAGKILRSVSSAWSGAIPQRKSNDQYTARAVWTEIWRRQQIMMPKIYQFLSRAFSRLEDFQPALRRRQCVLRMVRAADRRRESNGWNGSLMCHLDDTQDQAAEQAEQGGCRARQPQEHSALAAAGSCGASTSTMTAAAR